MPFALGLDAAIALFKRFKSLFVIVPLLVLLGLSHCSDKRHTRQRDEARAEVDMLKRASAANLAAQQAQVKAMEAKYTQQAKEAQTAYDQAIANVRPAVVRYIDSHRLHPDSLRCSASGSPGEAPNPGLPAQVPSDTGMVAIRTDHLQNLVDWSIVGILAHNGAVTEIDDGTAEAVRAGVPDPAFGD